MSGIIFGSGATGQAGVYAQIRSLLTGQIANGVTLESYTISHWSSYANTTPEQPGSGEYALTVPSYLVAGIYKATYYVPLGMSPSAGDTPFATETFYWDGTNVVGLTSPLNVGSINGSATAAINLGISANAFVIGAAAAGTLTLSSMTTNLLSPNANIYAGRVLIFTGGANVGRAVLVTGYTPSGGKIAFSAYNNQPINVIPSVGDSFLIL